MNIIKEGNKGKIVKIQPINPYRKYRFVCKDCGCIFEAETTDFTYNVREFGSNPVIHCPTCNQYFFKSQGKRIRNRNINTNV